jgi:amino acid transporter
MIYFVTTCGISTKLASVQNNIVTYVKFLPLIFAFVVGFIIFITHNGHPLNPV